MRSLTAVFAVCMLFGCIQHSAMESTSTTVSHTASTSTTTTSIDYTNRYANMSAPSTVGKAYDIIELGNDDLVVSCPKPCGIPLNELTIAYDEALLEYAWLKSVCGIEIVDELRPVELHFQQDRDCPKMYPTSYYSYNEQGRGRICVFKQSKDRRGLIVHELTHMLFRLRTNTYYVLEEGFCKAFEIRRNGGRAGNVTSLCDPVFKAKSESVGLAEKSKNLMYELCVNHGFDYDRMDMFFIAVEHVYETQGKPVNTRQIREIMDGLAGEDTSGTFRNAGLVT